MVYQRPRPRWPAVFVGVALDAITSASVTLSDGTQQHVAVGDDHVVAWSGAFAGAAKVEADLPGGERAICEPLEFGLSSDADLPKGVHQQMSCYVPHPPRAN